MNRIQIVLINHQLPEFLLKNLFFILLTLIRCSKYAKKSSGMERE